MCMQHQRSKPCSKINDKHIWQSAFSNQENSSHTQISFPMVFFCTCTAWGEKMITFWSVTLCLLPNFYWEFLKWKSHMSLCIVVLDEIWKKHHSLKPQTDSSWMLKILTLRVFLNHLSGEADTFSILRRDICFAKWNSLTCPFFNQWQVTMSHFCEQCRAQLSPLTSSHDAVSVSAKQSNASMQCHPFHLQSTHICLHGTWTRHSTLLWKRCFSICMGPNEQMEMFAFWTCAVVCAQEMLTQLSWATLSHLLSFQFSWDKFTMMAFPEMWKSQSDIKFIRFLWLWVPFSCLLFAFWFVELFLPLFGVACFKWLQSTWTALWH